MILRIIGEYLGNRFQAWIGRRIFRRTRLRHTLRKQLAEIVDSFADAMADTDKTCSLLSVINSASSCDISQAPRIRCLLKTVVIRM